MDNVERGVRSTEEEKEKEDDDAEVLGISGWRSCNFFGGLEGKWAPLLLSVEDVFAWI